MFVGKTFIYGEGTDSTGDFFLKGSVKGFEVAFDKQYVGVDGYIVGRDWNSYQGTFDQTFSTITGIWRQYINGEKAVYNGIKNPAEGRDVYKDDFTLTR